MISLVSPVYLSVATAAPLEEVMLTGILCESSGLA